MARVRITKLPKALSGLEMKMSAGLYGKGTNGNPQFRKSSYLEAGKISQQPTEVRDTLQPVAREGANLEAEKGETAMVNIDGIPAHFKIGGKRHSEGGTPLNLPDNSFIFSDTAKMKIKDPIMLAQFGMVPKKSGYTPAEIAKKYDINKLRQVLADPNTTDLERKTAELMISNYNMKLAKLALLQESSKGFPQGIPVVAMPYVMATGMNPEEFAQVGTQGEEEQPEADMGEQRYGGNIVSQFDTKQYGGLPTAQEGNLPIDTNIPSYAKYEDLYGNYYDENYELIDENEKGYFSPSGTKELLKKIYKHGTSEAPYLGSATPEGLELMSKDLIKPIGADISQARNINDLRWKKRFSKINPYNVPSNGIEGAFDWAGNLVNIPLSLSNQIFTGKAGTTGNLAGDVILDPLTYYGPTAAIKGTYKIAEKYGPKTLEFIQKYGPRALKYLGKYGNIAVEAIKKYGKEGIDYVIEKTPELLLKFATSDAASSLTSRAISGYQSDTKKEDRLKASEKQNKELKEKIAKLQTAPTAATTVTSVLQPKTKKPTTTPITETNQPKKYNWVK